MGGMLCMGGVNYLVLVVGMVSMDDYENLNIMCLCIKIECEKLVKVVKELK